MEIILFICKANVGRSQIAEWLFNSRNATDSIAISMTWCEARKEKYQGRPAEKIVSYMRNYTWVDISWQTVNYVTDFPEKTLMSVKKVVFLYDPLKEPYCEELCKINNKSPYEYLKTKWFQIQIYSVPDPYDTWEKGYREIIDMIQCIVSDLCK